MTWGLAALTAWSAALITYRRLRGQPVGALLPIVMGFVLIRGIAGIATQSGAVYFGPYIFLLLLGGMAALCSVAIRRPFGVYAAGLAYPFPRRLREHPVYYQVFARLTTMWGLLGVSMGLLQIWLLATGGIDRYMVVRVAVGWPLLIALTVYTLRYPVKALTRHPETARLLGGTRRRRAAR